MKDQATLPHSHQEMMALFMNKPLVFEPGTKWEYSNSNYLLLGYIIEKVTGKSYEQEVRERILQPLKMTSSGFDFAHLNSPDKATGYFALGKNPQVAPVVDSTASFAAGALYSTVEDLYKWDRGLYTDKILSANSKKQAFTPFKDKYGYGWFIDTLFNKPYYMHSGGIFGFTSHILRFPEDELVVILLDNSSSGKLQDIASKLAALAYNQPYELPKEAHEITVPESILKMYVGEYQISPDFSITITLENGGLMAQPTNQGKFNLYAETETLFFLKVVDAKVEFKKDDKGVVNGIILHQNGKDIPGKKK
jgi:CubicO group peptidase (beta-lactamase class C family)